MEKTDTLLEFNEISVRGVSRSRPLADVDGRLGAVALGDNECDSEPVDHGTYDSSYDDGDC